MDRAPVVFFFGDRFQCVQAAQLSGQLCLLAVLALTSEEMMECGLETVQWIKVCCLYCCQARIFFSPLPVPIPKKHQVGRKFPSEVLIRSPPIKKVTVDGCANADCFV